jgi:small-conductance mechanosensitive channel
MKINASSYVVTCVFCFLTCSVFLDKSFADKRESVPPPISVSYAGVQLFNMHYGVGSFSPLERSKALRDRISKLASNKVFDVNTISLSESDSSSDINAGDVTLASITDRDARAEGANERILFAQQVQESIKSAIEKDRKDKSPHNIAVATSYAGLATLILIICLLGLHYLFRFLFRFVSTSKGTLIRSLKIKSLELLTADRIAGIILWFLNLVRIITIFIIFYIYVPLVLSLFPWTANFAPKLLSFILVPLNRAAHVMINFLPNIFFIFIIVMASRYILRFINILFNEIEMGTLNIDGFHREWAVPTYKLVRILVLAFTLVVLFPYLPGSGSPAFQGVSVFLGILLSFGSSSSIGNIVAGIVLTYMRPFKVGDRVKISDTVGDVVEKTLLVTRLRTIKNVDVTIPNSMILASHIINYSSSALSSGLILNTTVTIGYDSPWNIVHDLLKKAALITTDILQDPSPYILQTSLDDFYVSYELNAFTRHPNRMANIYSELHRNIQDTFNDAGVEIMSPHYTSLRDGNEVTIPSDKRADGYISPKFKIDSNTEK